MLNDSDDKRYKLSKWDEKKKNSKKKEQKRQLSNSHTISPLRRNASLWFVTISVKTKQTIFCCTQIKRSLVPTGIVQSERGAFKTAVFCGFSSTGREAPEKPAD